MLEKVSFIMKNTPSVTFGDSSLSEGALPTKNILRLLFIDFLLTGNSFFEPCDYPVVFVLQQSGTQKSTIISLSVKLCCAR